MWSRIETWIKRPENIAYVVLVTACLVIAGRTYSIVSILLGLLVMAVAGFLIRKIFFRE
jgi:hypothetical protein